jgi:TPR repeat protein
MSLVSVVPDHSLERAAYHLLEASQLEVMVDAEALFEKGRRLRQGVGVAINEAAGWALTISAAKLGHPIALAYCLDSGYGVAQDQERAAKIYGKSAELGHPVGELWLLSKI